MDGSPSAWYRSAALQRVVVPAGSRWRSVAESVAAHASLIDILATEQQTAPKPHRTYGAWCIARLTAELVAGLRASDARDAHGMAAMNAQNIAEGVT